MQFNLFALLAAASTATAAAFSGCEQGDCPDHSAAIDMIETNHNGGDVVTTSIRVSDGGKCHVFELRDTSYCASFSFHHRPARACFDTGAMKGTLQFFDLNPQNPETFCFGLDYEREPSQCITQIWWFNKYFVC
ncbi:hypothetical protein VHEMI03015 [[Torrubiella] hemipterigena]|uniref:AA1-like domain-containing protein n=1 Tax=[Torrubiella] hemipterigena TaxID=1531966 RepID=A0A0A1TC70_9HYPO|nr:hypothetical protein VHEMI03015 [[Torrubiella] hemipterigena]